LESERLKHSTVLKSPADAGLSSYSGDDVDIIVTIEGSDPNVPEQSYIGKACF
jgi:hypothetical protein